MTQLAQKLLNQLYQVNPYQNFDYTKFPQDLQGWGSQHPLFEQVINASNPRLILEVGTWKGASAIHMASLLKAKQLDSAIICIDTWLGGLDNISDDPISGINQYRQYGYPNLYYQFLANVLYTQTQDYIIPLPNTSPIASKYLLKLNLKADLIYIDGSHDEDDVYADLVNYWKLLNSGGFMIGDDWNAGEIWYGVICGVNRFVKENNLDLRIINEKWLLEKK